MSRWIFPLVAFFFLMYLFYLDESGTPEIPGTSPTFTLAAIGIPVGSWTKYDKEIRQLKTSYGLADAEIHVAWIARRYMEQEKIRDFEKMDWVQRRDAVDQERILEITKKQSEGKDVAQLKKNFRRSEAYIHLTRSERNRFLLELAQLVGKWSTAKIFAEIIQKENYQPPKQILTPMTQAFEQVVVRIESYLHSISHPKREVKKQEKHKKKKRGLLIYDNNPSIAEQLTKNMKKFYRQGTFLAEIDHIIETPLFVSSELTGLIQIADLCAFALRRAIENNDPILLEPLLPIIDRRGKKMVGVRHYVGKNECNCIFCKATNKHPQKGNEKV